MAIVSRGWNTTSYPTHAELEVSGSSATVPANSYQRTTIGGGNVILKDQSRLDFTDSTLSISGGNFHLSGARLSDLASSSCSQGTCVAITAGEKGYDFNATTYGLSPGKLADKQDFELVVYDKAGAKIASERVSVAFDDEVIAVFGAELDIEGDPVGGDASGSVTLLGAADKKGKQATLAKGSYYGSFARDGDGDLALGGYGADEWATAESDAEVELGDAVECGGEGCEGDWKPPVVARGIPENFNVLLHELRGLALEVTLD